MKTEITKVKNENKKILKPKSKSEKQNVSPASPSRFCSNEAATNPPQHVCVELTKVSDAASDFLPFDPADHKLHSLPNPPGCTTDHAPQKACDDENNFVSENVNKSG